MDRPLVGITCYGEDERGLFRAPRKYVDAVVRAGGNAVLLPPIAQSWPDLLARVDGVIFAGGGDIDPDKYGGQVHKEIYNIDPERDAVELEMVRLLVSRLTPTLGICRGVQVINVALGGTLIEHVPDDVGEEILHRAPQRSPTEHQIQVEPGTCLAAIMQAREFPAASWHHQAIRRPAANLRVAATAPDGTIEAVECPGHPWLVGVQWHPELTADSDTIQQRLFDALVRAAKDRMG